MRASLKALCIALFMALFSQSAFAGWYTSHGSAAIINGDRAAARRAAIDDALRNASLQAGADISIEQVLENGTLLDEKLRIKAKSPIRRMQVVEEQENGKVITVLVKALIDDDSVLDCYAGNIKKTILPFKFRYQDPEASASAAGLEDFDEYLSKIIYAGIAQSPALTILPADKSRLLTHQGSSGPDYNLQRTLDSISRRTQAQFIVVGNISSIAKSDTGNNELTKMWFSPVRTIRFNVQVYDVYNGRQILNKEYTGDAEWNLKGAVNIRTDRFASSDYGQRVNQIAKYAIADIVSKLRCQVPYARVVQINDELIRINLGEGANIKPGMKFSVIHRTDYTDRHSMTYFQNNTTKSTYKVINVSPNAATLAPVDMNNSLINVMLDDLVVLKEEM
ncbi:MAG: flagellar assembly protein T N-terminal domain-containing protein [Anaerobiospirillum succiniciproducens]|uniref:flagellar assembly protein T N-terminal domain-containing protein n=1 Tax=Anaerobiospirillum succiniciproducens TaxID=13335 RepID=UPI0026DC0F67|nr:flagellar assembly protein T N-terminal domain-containing protein [Anaerobiospirillum succiniciproducens]MDO4676672.1 flagellar assembly protein T N-terminal domain-containing protein [Anaerobiospirillum succiniciproducens]